MQYQLPLIVPIENKMNDNYIITLSGTSSTKPFSILATNKIFSFDTIEKTQCLPLYTYDKNGNRIDNITDWGLQQFREYYQNNNLKTVIAKGSNNTSNLITPNTNSPEAIPNCGEIASGDESVLAQDLSANNPLRNDNKEITKEDIFYYVYAVLHNPEYRKKYELNLKREFPRIPFYDDFYQWVNWGKQLMELHLNYETIEPYPLKIVNTSDSVIARRKNITNKSNTLNNNLAEAISVNDQIGSGGLNIRYPELLPKTPPRNDNIKPKLKADKNKNQIILDDVTTLTGIPEIAWEYQLGNRSALEWILDQYKEKKPKDPTIAKMFNNYRFADYKETVIDLLMRVTTVSVETMKIIKQMENIFA